MAPLEISGRRGGGSPQKILTSHTRLEFRQHTCGARVNVIVLFWEIRLFISCSYGILNSKYKFFRFEKTNKQTNNNNGSTKAIQFFARWRLPSLVKFERHDWWLDLYHSEAMLSLGGIQSFVFARQASARREFSARLAVQKQSFFILLRLNMAAEW